MININLSKSEEKALKLIAKSKGTSVDALIKTMILEKLEDVKDRRTGEEALEEYKQNPVTYTINEVFNI